jgi:phospholipid/cholesterol/gamma-HCH transport system ATP-binding protein
MSEAARAQSPSDGPSHGRRGSRSAPIISCRNVVKRYPGKTVLSGVTFDVYPGEVMVVMGNSGCGKSTLLRTLIGSIKPDEGEIFLFGQDIAKLDEEGLNEVRKRFGILFQSGALFNSLTVGENIALPMLEHTDLDPAIIDLSVRAKLAMVRLEEAIDRTPSQLSGGMKKRAGLARALALDPELLFYDEPSAGLDPVVSAQIDQLIAQLCKQLNTTSVVVTHEMDSAFTIADRMMMLHQGRVLKIETRAWYERLRNLSDAEASELPETERLIRQFIRGSHKGPLTEGDGKSAALEKFFGIEAERPVILATPSVESTRARTRTFGLKP